MQNEYVYPEVLTSTDWVFEHLENHSTRIIESDEDYLLYETGHIPGSIKLDWFTTLQDPVRRDFINKDAFEELCGKVGITNETTVVFYGDRFNWFACYAFWLFEYYGHPNKCIMDGGRLKWEFEGRPMLREVKSFPRTRYKAQQPNHHIRAFRDQVMVHQEARLPLIDVRSAQEFSGELIHMVNYPQEGATRGGHIPGAINIPWSFAVNEESGTFKTTKELAQIYLANDLSADKPVITYCRIGERSALTWFVLKYLLGFRNVRNYDGSWTEWGNLVNVPIAKGNA